LPPAPTAVVALAAPPVAPAAPPVALELVATTDDPIPAAPVFVPSPAAPVVSPLPLAPPLPVPADVESDENSEPPHAATAKPIQSHELRRCIVKASPSKQDARKIDSLLILAVQANAATVGIPRARGKPGILSTPT
jgi:hypothetical protein